MRKLTALLTVVLVLMLGFGGWFYLGGTLRGEVAIQSAFARMMKGRTSFIVAHRLSTVREADVILVMQGGRIVEQGDHAALLEKNGFYAELYRSQFEAAG